MESVWSVSKLSTESVGSRRELVANCVHTADADATKQFRRVGGVYWALLKVGYVPVSSLEMVSLAILQEFISVQMLHMLSSIKMSV